tara:strand:+ start:110 stop:565 length:456 start_codon:yes stop_codon:yes gene_type:complete
MGSIYKVSDGERDYYGSTAMTLTLRLRRHKDQSNGSSSKVLNRDNLTIELMEEVEDESQLKIREQYYLDNYECVNINRAYTSPEQWKQYHKQYHKQWKQENKDKLKEYRGLHRDKTSEWEKTKITCVCGAVVTKNHKARHEKTAKHLKNMS